MTEKSNPNEPGMYAFSADQRRVQAADYVSLYVNNVTVSISTWDMAINFGRVKTVDSAVIEEKAEIVMSKELAKALLELMTVHIGAYEKVFGEIKLPRDFQDLKKELLEKDVSFQEDEKQKA